MEINSTQLCEKFETFNPEVEFQKLIKRKPIVQTTNLFQPSHIHNEIKRPHNFKSYEVKNDDIPMYRTSSSEYGFYPPNSYTIPARSFPLSQKFTNDLARTGMYRNHSLNTPIDAEFY